jgi:hypothetical protein
MKQPIGIASKSFARRWLARIRARLAMAIVLFTMGGVLAACHQEPSTELAEAILVALAHGLTHGPDRVAHGTTRQKALAAGSYALSSSTPSIPFNGNQFVVVDPPLASGATAVAAASLQRAANCTFTETVTEPVSGIFSPPASLDLPNAQDYFHQLAGLTTQADVFPRGCVDSLRGKRSVFSILPVSLTATTLRFVDISSTTEQLEATSVDRTTGAVTTTTLTSGRAQAFYVVDVNGDGLNDIVASGVGFAAGVNGNIVVFLNNGDGTYRTTANIPNAGSTFTIDDVNGDGKVDIVIDNGFVNGTQVPGVSTLLGNGDGTFQPAVASAAGAAQVFGPMVTGDFTGDGKLDILLGTQILIGNGDGTFVAGPALPSSLTSEIGFNAAVGDLNRDGKLDVVYTGFGFVQVLLGNGDGTFTTGARYASLGSPQPVAVTEIDGDGNLDLIVGNASQGLVFGTFDDSFVGRFQVLLGHGDGTFVGAPLYNVGIVQNSAASQFATADFDSDGKVDVLAIDNANTGNSNGLDVLPGTGQSNLGTAIRSTTTIGASMVVAVDLNGDAKPDVVAAGQGGSGFVVATLLNQGGGHLGAEHDYDLPAFPDAIAVGDFDGDGRPDIAVAVGSLSFASTGPPGVYVLYGQADGTFTAPVQIDGSVLPQSVAVADINGDGRADLAVVDFGPGNGNGALHVYLGNANRTFTAAATPVTAGATRFSAVAFGDVNGDGKQDLLVGATVPGATFGSATSNLYTFLGNGDGTFGAAQVVPMFGNDGDITAIAIGDLDHDGHADVVVGIQNDYTEVLLGAGDGTYGHNLLALGEHPNAIAVADLDGDHFPELLIGIAGDGLAVMRNAGTAAAWAGTPVTGPTPPTTGDFTVAASPAAGSVVAGQSVQTTISVAPTGGFSQTVTLACTAGLPTNATCTFSPASVTPNGTAAASSSLTIATHAASGVAAGTIGTSGGSGGGPGGLFVGLLGGLALLAHKRRPALGRWAGIAAVSGLLVSCGGDGGDSNTSTPPSAGTTSTITITGTSGSASHSVTYALTVH